MNERRQVAQALRDAARTLSETSDTARLDAELLMAEAMGVSRSDMLVRHMDDPVPAAFDALVERRATHEPIAYILGQQEFFGLPFIVDPDVLIPRSDSETLVERAIACQPGARRILDCGTGSGALLLAVLHNLPEATGIGIDNAPTAVEIASRNAAALGLRERAAMRLADWTAPGWYHDLGGPFDLVLANPPYVEATASLEPSVRNFEPVSALFAGKEGLDAYRVLVPQLPGLLAPGGIALAEIGATQDTKVAAIAEASGLLTTLHRDMANRPRVLQLTFRQ